MDEGHRKVPTLQPKSAAERMTTMSTWKITYICVHVGSVAFTIIPIWAIEISAWGMKNIPGAVRGSGRERLIYKTTYRTGICAQVQVNPPRPIFAIRPRTDVDVERAESRKRCRSRRRSDAALRYIDVKQEVGPTHVRTIRVDQNMPFWISRITFRDNRRLAVVLWIE
jgi:hypothetical protein